jgi:hypothetical protein
VFLAGFGRSSFRETVTSWGPGVVATARFDLLRDGAAALFARAAFDADIEIHGGPYWGPSIGLGADFDLVGSRDALAKR